MNKLLSILMLLIISLVVSCDVGSKPKNDNIPDARTTYLKLLEYKFPDLKGFEFVSDIEELYYEGFIDYGNGKILSLSDGVLELKYGENNIYNLDEPDESYVKFNEIR